MLIGAVHRMARPDSTLRGCVQDGNLPQYYERQVNHVGATASRECERTGPDWPTG